MFDTFSRYTAFRNTTLYNYDVHMILRYQFLDFCGLSLLCGLQDMAPLCVLCAVLILYSHYGQRMSLQTNVMTPLNSDGNS